MSFQVSPKGFYGNFGGAFVPEMLWANVQELADHYLVFLNDPAFLEEYHQLLRDYVGRPTPLYRAARLSAKYGTQIFLKREDLCHTGAHKVNNTVGQILMAERWGKSASSPKPAPGNTALPPPRSAPCAGWNVSCSWEKSTSNARRPMWRGCGCSAQRCGRPAPAA